MSRQQQLYFVLAVAFVIPVISSAADFAGWLHPHPATHRAHVFAVVYELTALSCLYLVLRRQKRSFKDIGVVLPMRIAEIGHSFVLLAAVFVAGLLTFAVILAVYVAAGNAAYHPFDAARIFGSQITLATVLFVLINPFYEELIVRAFLITEMEQLYKSTGLAVLVSVELQTFYHLYQGVPAALVHASTFFLFSLYFVRTRRIMPVVMTHLFLDALALVAYAKHLAPH